MEDIWIYILLGVSILSLLIGFFCLMVSLKNRNGKGSTSELEKQQIQSTAEIKAALNNTKDQISSAVEVKISENQYNSLKALQEERDKNQEDLKSFEKSIQDYLNQEISKINETINTHLGEIEMKNTQQRRELNSSLALMSKNDSERIQSFQTSITTSLNQQLDQINKHLNESIQQINDKVNLSLSDGFKGTSESMSSLQKQLGIVEEAQKNIASLQSEISSLTGILSNNQQRGKYGEWQLELLLENMFPSSKGVLYDTQYVLEEAKDGDSQLKPDAVIFLDGESHSKIIAIDSKFSLTGYEDLFDTRKHLTEAEINERKGAFKQATKRRIEETSKYIIKGKTIANALMFIPNDGVFAYVENEFPELSDYARSKNVVMVSPTILQPLLASFRVIQIDSRKSKNLEKINEALESLHKDFLNFMPRWNALNKNIQSLTVKSSQFDTTVNKIGKRFDKVQTMDLKEEDTPEIEEENEDNEKGLSEA